jgi:hypothetical protein
MKTTKRSLDAMGESLTRAALAVKARDVEARRQCFTAEDLTSRPTPDQEEIFKGIDKYLIRIIRAGNQCLVGSTLVATPKGPVQIKDIRVGDTVYDEHGKEITVVNTYVNGKREVADLTFRGVPYARATKDHVWLCRLFSREDGSLIKEHQLPGSKFTQEDSVVRNKVRAPLGNVSVPYSYVIGAMLGDGCSLVATKYMHISSGSHHVPVKCGTLLGAEVVKLNGQNHTWKVKAPRETDLYRDWCYGRYAHEKIVDIDVIKTWDRETLLNFVAGLVDTDGSVSRGKDHISIALSMQAKSVVDAFTYACLSLWQVQLHQMVDSRTKYKNGPCHTAYVRDAVQVRHMLEELDPYLVSPQRKRWRTWTDIEGRRQRAGVLRLTWGANPSIEDTYDIHVSSPTNLYMLANGLVTHNSGKSRTAGRDLSWFMNREHPYINVTKTWGAAPLLAIVCGADRAITTTILWKKCIKPLLTNPSEWHAPGEDSDAGVKVARNTRTGDQIVFLSHNHARPDDIKHMFGYDAHAVWIDEMPKEPEVIEELTRRIDARRGRLIMTFTQKTRNPRIQKVVDRMSPEIAHTYRLAKLDNPVYGDRREEELAKIAHLSPEMQRAILYGDWIESSTKIFNLDYDRVRVPLPASYSQRWPHLVSVDPATETQLGLVVLAGDPESGRWYVVRSMYIGGLYVPTKIVRAVEDVVASMNINVVRRIYDSAAPWYAHQAAEMGFNYIPISDKAGNKDNNLAHLQEGFDSVLHIVQGNDDLESELDSYERSEKNADVIKNSNAYHLIDALTYGYKCRPQLEVRERGLTYDQALHSRIVQESENRAERQKKLISKFIPQRSSWRSR